MNMKSLGLHPVLSVRQLGENEICVHSSEFSWIKSTYSKLMLCVLGDINENGLIRFVWMGNLDMSDLYLYSTVQEIRLQHLPLLFVTCTTLNYKIYASKQCKCMPTS